MNAKKQLKKINTLRRIANNMEKELTNEVKKVVMDTIDCKIEYVSVENKKLVITLDNYGEVKTEDVIKLQEILGSGVITNYRYYISE